MKIIDFRSLFQREWLPGLFLDETNYYIDSVNNATEAEAIEDFWYDMIIKCKMAPECFPLEFSVNTYHYDDDIYFSIIEMPEITKAKGKNLAIYAMLVFDIKGKIPARYFLGETDYNPITKRSIFIAEFYKMKYSLCEGWLGRYNYGPLCKRNKATGNYTFSPVEKENELDEFIDRVLEIYKAGE